MREHAVEPLRLTLADGQEREFLLTWAGYKRVKAHFHAHSFQQVLEHEDGEEVVPFILWTAMLNKNGMTQEQFEELLPCHMNTLTESVKALLMKSEPDKADLPTRASDPANQ